MLGSTHARTAGQLPWAVNNTNSPPFASLVGVEEMEEEDAAPTPLPLES